MWTKLVVRPRRRHTVAAGADIHGTIIIDRKTIPSQRHRLHGNVSARRRRRDWEPMANWTLSSSSARTLRCISKAVPNRPPRNSPGASIEQRDRRFVPDLVVIPASATVAFPNFDPIFHNVFSLSKAKSFDLGNYREGQSRLVTFPVPGLVAVYCTYLHIRTWRRASSVQRPSRWAVRVDRDGVFSLKDVAPGTYTVVAWHKTAGTFRKTVTIAEKDTAVSFTPSLHRTQ